MSSVTITYLGQVAPEYSSFSDTDRFNALKTIAENMISATVFGFNTDYAVALTIAHMLKMGELRGIGGEVTKEKIGDEEYQYTSMGNNSTFVTGYSKELERLKKSIIVKSPILFS
jgi:hypothetical protein